MQCLSHTHSIKPHERNALIIKSQKGERNAANASILLRPKGAGETSLVMVGETALVMVGDTALATVGETGLATVGETSFVMVGETKRNRSWLG